MGFEAGGHRGSFLAEDMSRQVGTFALVPQVADAVTVPVIAAGGIADARGICAAFALGAAAVQIGTAYPLKAKSEAAGSGDFTNLWSGQSAGLARRGVPAGQLTLMLAQEALQMLSRQPAP